MLDTTQTSPSPNLHPSPSTAQAELCEIVNQLANMGPPCSDQVIDVCSNRARTDDIFPVPKENDSCEWVCRYEQDTKILINLNKNHTILSISEGARILLGYNNGDLFGRPLQSIQGPRTEKRKLAAIIDSIRSPASCRTEHLVFYKQDACEVEQVVRASATTFRGLPACVLHLLPCPTDPPLPPPSLLPERGAPPATTASAKSLDAIQELDPEVRSPTLRENPLP